jgi:uncharacterized protein YqjF (DUF2071 family)
MKTHFLRAEWNNLILANYIVPQEVLLPYLPAKTELALFQGNAYVSLVGLMFLNTRVLGLSIPLHTNFEEINLRFYIKYCDNGHWKNGVVFIKEIVSKKSISFIANFVYGENYSTMKMKHYHIESPESFECGYEWNDGEKWNKLSAVTNKKSNKIIPGSCESFFADHYWGYSKHSDVQTYEYHVEHDVWETLKVTAYSVDCDFEALYGEKFSFLNKQQPNSVLVTKGSEIKVHHKKELAL